MSTSFPFLKIARDHGLSYGQVIRFVQYLDDYQHLLAPPHWSQSWQAQTAISWLEELGVKVEPVEINTIEG